MVVNSSRPVANQVRHDYFSSDPVGFAARDANLYRYVGNKATMLLDPDGLTEKLPPWASERLTDDIYIRVDKGRQVYGGFEIHVCSRGGTEVAKIDGKGHWCQSHGGQELQTPTKFKANYKNAIVELRMVIRREAHAAARAGWRRGPRVTEAHAARIGATAVAVFALGLEAAEAMETFSENRKFEKLIEYCERGDVRSADMMANGLYEDLLFKAKNENWALGWKAAWKHVRKDFILELQELQRAQ